ncbi:MAG: hypothetical protein ACOX88_04340 [Christensenellales bacterium]|jgi:hypothetical protein
MITTFRIIVIIAALGVSIWCLTAALVNLSKIKKNRSSSFGKGMCVYLIVVSVILALEAGLFLAM